MQFLFPTGESFTLDRLREKLRQFAVDKAALEPVFCLQRDETGRNGLFLRNRRAWGFFKRTDGLRKLVVRRWGDHEGDSLGSGNLDSVLWRAKAAKPSTTVPETDSQPELPVHSNLRRREWFFDSQRISRAKTGGWHNRLYNKKKSARLVERSPLVAIWVHPVDLRLVRSLGDHDGFTIRSFATKKSRGRVHYAQARSS